MNLKRIGCDQSIDVLTSNKYCDSKLNAVISDDHHYVINQLVAVSHCLSITTCKSVLTLHLRCVKHSLKTLNVQLNPVNLINDNDSKFDDFFKLDKKTTENSKLERITLNPPNIKE